MQMRFTSSLNFVEVYKIITIDLEIIIIAFEKFFNYFLIF